MLGHPITLSLPAWIDDEIDAAAVYSDDETRVALAIHLAERNVTLGTGGPFGAAVFTAEGRLVAVGVNRVIPQNCSVAHAEMMAFIGAQARLGRHRLNEGGERFVLATSAQPCCQCYGATFWAGIDELLIGARAEDVMSLTAFDEGPLPTDWIGELARRGITVRRDIHREEARAALRRYGEAEGQTY